MKEFVKKLIERLEKKVRSCEISMRHKFAYNRDYQYVDGKRVAFKECLEIVNQLAEEYNQDSTKNNQGWILCSEKLPKAGKRYLVTAVWRDKDFEKHSVYDFVYGSDGAWHGENYEAVEYCEVIAWQPLPDPYKPEEKQEEPQPSFYSERFNRVL